MDYQNQTALQSQEEIDNLIDAFDIDYYHKCESRRTEIFSIVSAKHYEPLQKYERELQEKIVVRQAQRKKELTKEYKLKNGKKPWKADYFNANKEVEDTMNEESAEYIKNMNKTCLDNTMKELETNVSFQYYQSVIKNFPPIKKRFPEGCNNGPMIEYI